jgi:hypothetical protein
LNLKVADYERRRRRRRRRREGMSITDPEDGKNKGRRRVWGGREEK